MAQGGTTVRDHDLITAALQGLQAQIEKIEDLMQQVRSRLGQGGAPAAQAPVKRRGRPPKGSGTPTAVAPKAAKSSGRRPLSAAARKRIAAAQKRRWAEYRRKAG
jgi:hypothetical protein